MNAQEEAASVDYRAIRDAEIAEARGAGLGWTPYLPFINAEERLGAMVCSCRRRNRLPSVVVSYCTGFPARVVLCQTCVHLGIGR